MSRLTDFAARQFIKARAIIGGEAIAIGGGAAISIVPAETQIGREYEEGGFDSGKSKPVVVSIADWSANYPADPKSYIGKVAICGGETFRVAGVSPGASFVTVRLTQTAKGA